MVTVILAFIVVILSALCSGSEASLFSASAIKARQMAEDGSRRALSLVKIKDHMSRPISAIVIFNNIANISGTILVATQAKKEFGETGVWATTFIFPILVIVFSEIIPKNLGESKADIIALHIAGPILTITTILTWLGLIPAVELISRIFGRHTGNEPTTDENEIRFLTKLGRDEGVIEKNESEMIENVFQLNDVRASALMTPRVMMTYLKADSTLEEARENILHSQHSRIVLIGENSDDIIGVVFKTELLSALLEKKHKRKLRSFAHKVRFVPEQASADKLLKSFQESRQHLAVVTDQYSGVAGVISLEDILEVLTGEIVDETDRSIDLQQDARQMNPMDQSQSN